MHNKSFNQFILLQSFYKSNAVPMHAVKTWGSKGTAATIVSLGTNADQQAASSNCHFTHTQTHKGSC
jgi:hypothetical protein